MNEAPTNTLSPPIVRGVAMALLLALASIGGTRALGQTTAAAPAGGAIFVNVVLQKHELYVGESLPVVIQVGAQDDIVASLDSPPNLRGDAFTLNVLSGEPEREQRVIDGKPCTVLAWRSVLAAVKPGTLSLTVEAPLTVRVPVAQHAEPNYADESTGDPYSDPAFQSLLQTTVAQSVVASSPPVSFQVLALPTEDRPANFSGAVGSFTISSEVSKARTVVGEPMTLRLHVQGAGNFDRVSSSMLGAAQDWKTFRPTAAFMPAEKTGFSGEKTFEQAVVATQPGSRTLPPLEFSYFDPQTRRYATARAAPLSVEVAPGPTGAAPPGAPLAARTTPTDAARRPATAPGASLARGDRTARGAATDSLVPLYLQPRFLGMPALLLFALGGVWFKRTQHSASGARSAAAGALGLREASLNELEHAAACGDSARFFRSAGRVLRQAGMLDHDAEVGEILRLVDEADYAGEVPHGADLRHCRHVILRCLATRAGVNPVQSPARTPSGFPAWLRSRRRDR